MMLHDEKSSLVFLQEVKYKPIIVKDISTFYYGGLATIPIINFKFVHVHIFLLSPCNHYIYV
jgi:hypothetical protein